MEVRLLWDGLEGGIHFVLEILWCTVAFDGWKIKAGVYFGFQLHSACVGSWNGYGGRISSSRISWRMKYESV
ncbi:hypothetical protein HBH98_078080 [Parastagonospora nodorum]|nr:hypothetical protein HBH46_083640 [Parastagonospora nodorum]KAH4190379.1 hypothetical protein HBH42_128150 [Parastagonospora nodorum]KAH4348237.1 hypothetical protein HBH98_078080 [Parastagonospora nodorum]KAH4390172.1 hypothetical protein HBH97_049110 [Parastagonospora nodorum]KAH4414745.1 hypothetical protein HBH99_067930 [Parastagonospora nodorum]